MSLIQRRDGVAAKDTPMMAQYKAMKAENPDALLFFRLGDFYELFFEDAEAAAPLLDIALTRRGQADGVDVPMCGVPVHSAEGYLERLIRHGKKVAICEQVEDPAAAKRRGGKTLVRRDVVRVVTPGTLTEDTLLDGRSSAPLAALAAANDGLGLAHADLSTGAFAVEPVAAADLGAALARVGPSELLVGPKIAGRYDAALDPWGSRLSEVEAAAFGQRSRRSPPLPALRRRDVGRLRRLHPGRNRGDGRLAGLPGQDAARRRRPPRSAAAGGRRGAHAPRPGDAAQPRSLERRRRRPERLVVARPRPDAHRRRRPPLGRAALGPPGPARTAAATARTRSRPWSWTGELRDAVRERLKGLPDMARALGRLALGRGGPRDLAALAEALDAAADLRATLDAAPPALAGFAKGIAPHADLAAILRATLDDRPPLQARDGGFVRDGADADLDAARGLAREGRRHLMAMEADLKAKTGIPSLKIRQNNLIGAYIEVTASHLAKVPDGFVQRQGMAGATRYTTGALIDLERRIAGAAEAALGIELRLFETMRAAALADADGLARTAAGLAAIDVAAALAARAVEGGWVRPILEEGAAFAIENGRHPVVEAALAARQERFVANDCRLEGGARLWLLTGPNMAGKSTFLRQNALIAILAQTGSFVPAKSARIGLIDRLFSRVGAADDLARGQSTFMVEMVETATILHQATEKSLVILDEIGRGTATYDGLSLAWAVLEYLHGSSRCRGLFATHYHELTALAAKLDGLANHRVEVKEWQNEVVFLHEVAPGAADRSYGIHVARLAGCRGPCSNGPRRCWRGWRRARRARARRRSRPTSPCSRPCSPPRPDRPHPPPPRPSRTRLNA